MNSRFTIVTLMVTAVLIISMIPSCGAGNKPMRHESEYIPVVPIYTYRYYPYVERLEFSGELVPGNIITAIVTIILPDEIPEDLYYLNTTTNPVARWTDDSVYINVLLQESRDDAAGNPGLRRYDGSRQLIHHLLVPGPGEYELRYWSAASPDLAGEYAMELQWDATELRFSNLCFEVPEVE